MQDCANPSSFYFSFFSCFSFPGCARCAGNDWNGQFASLPCLPSHPSEKREHAARAMTRVWEEREGGTEGKQNIPGFSPKLPRHSGCLSRHGSQRPPLFRFSFSRNPGLVQYSKALRYITGCTSYSPFWWIIYLRFLIRYALPGFVVVLRPMRHGQRESRTDAHTH